ncbi:MAG: DUF72 domain-containing protein [Candidatus Bathyarchaeia archaeon]
MAAKQTKLTVERTTSPLENVLIGTSGWSYEEWVGPFYKAQESKFTVYSQVFNTAEINSTFYRYPDPALIQGFLRSSPPFFVFTAKLPQAITHERALEPGSGLESDLNRFLALMEPLLRLGKLGVLLAQFPPSFQFKSFDKLERFLALLPQVFRFAVEFRDLSWLRSETWRLLERYNVAYTAVDEPLLPPEMVYTADIAYIRWHGKGERPWFNYNYSDEELDAWVPRVKEAAEKTKRVFGYFNNHFHAYAPKNALEFLEKLGKASPGQVKVKESIQAYIAAKEAKLSPEEMPTSVEEALKLQLPQLLLAFADKNRIDRAETITQKEFLFAKRTPHFISAYVKEYTVTVDVASKTIRHSCDDWEKRAPKKEFCKHVVRVFLSLPEGMSKEVLAQMTAEKSLWRFEPEPPQSQRASHTRR